MVILEVFNVSNWIHSLQGGVHFISATLGMISGAYLLLAKKGTRIHTRIGYIFVTSLLLTNLSALFIYDFNNGRISVFHFLIPVSVFFLTYGMIPMIRKPRKAKSLNKHIIGMSGAAMGLWAAGATEYFVRELAYGMSKGELITYSFLISIPFAILITLSISVNLKKIRR